jgi:hypothetical protein
MYAMRMLALAAMAAVPVLGACQTPTQAEIAEAFSGVRTLATAGGAPLPFTESQAGARLEILSGSLTLTSQNITPDRRRCSFTLTYRESVDGGAVAEGTETAPCEFFRLLQSGIFFQLGEGAVQTSRFVNRSSCFAGTIGCKGSIEGRVHPDGSITIVDGRGVEFRFRR